MRLKKAADYSELPQSFVSFICTFDAFGEGRFRYTFQNVCEEDNKLLLDDGTSKVFFNTKRTKGEISEDAKNILKFIESNTAEDEFTEKLEQEVLKIKENKEWKVEYMTLLMREREKYREGKAAGKAAGVIEFALDLGYADESIISALQKKLGVDVAQAEDYLKRYYEGTL